MFKILYFTKIISNNILVRKEHQKNEVSLYVFLDKKIIFFTKLICYVRLLTSQKYIVKV